MTLFSKWVWPLIVVGMAMRLAVTIDRSCNPPDVYAPPHKDRAAVFQL